MAMNLELDSVHGYNPGTTGKIVCLGSGGYAYPQGTGVQFANVNNGTAQHWVPADGVHQITHCVLNPKGTLMVVAERRLSVNILVFSAADRRPLQRLTDICKVELKDCCFSRCGGYFATLAAGPTFQVSVFTVDAQTNKFHRIVASAPVTTPGGSGFHSFTSISFNPRDPTDIMTTGNGHAAFWKLSRGTALGAQWTIAHHEAKVTVSSVRLTAHAWTTGGLANLAGGANFTGTGNFGSTTFASMATFGSVSASASASVGLMPTTTSGTVLVGTMTGEVFEFDSSTYIGRLVMDLAGSEQNENGLVTTPEETPSRETREKKTTDAITSILIGKHNTLVATEDGAVRFCTQDMYVVKTVRLPILYNPAPRPKALDSSAPVHAGLRSLAFAPEWNTLLCGCADGSVYMMHLPGYENPTVPEPPNAKIAMVAASCTSAHHNIVAGVHIPAMKALMGSATAVATLNTEGCLRIFDYAQNKELLRDYLPGAGPHVEPTCMTIGSGDMSSTTLAIGYSNGVVQFVNIVPDNEGISASTKIMFHEKVTKKLSKSAPSTFTESIQLLRFDPSGTLCAAVTEQRSVIFFSLTGGAGSFDLKCIVHVVKISTTGADGSLSQHPVSDLTWFPQGEFAVLLSFANSDVVMLSVPSESDLAGYIAQQQNAAAAEQAAEATKTNTLARTGSMASGVSGGSHAAPGLHQLVPSVFVQDAFPTPQGELELPSSRVFVNSWRLDVPSHRLLVGALFDESIKIVGLGADKETKIYSLNRTLPADRKDRDTKQVRPDESFADHDKKAFCLEITRGRTLVTGGSEGRLSVRDIGNALSQATSATGMSTLPGTHVSRHCSVHQGVVSFCVSPDGLRLISFGGDGNMVVSTFGKQAAFTRGVYSPYALKSEPAKEDQDTHYFAEKRAVIQRELALVQHEAHRTAVKATLSKLSARLGAIRAENDSYDDDEKVNLDDFLVGQEKSRFRGKVDDATDEMRDTLHWDNVRRDYVIDLLKRDCLDVMQVPLTEVRAMLTGPEAARVLAAAEKKKKKDQPEITDIPVTAEHIVYNMPFRKADQPSLTVLRKLKFLRMVEQRDREVRKVEELENIRAPMTEEELEKQQQEQQDNVPQGSPTSPTSEDIAERQPLAVKGRKIEDEACDEVTPYLYNPWLVFTRQRAILQLRLLEGRLFQLKSNFNKDFAVLQQRKLDDINKMEERNNRAKIIVKELDEQHLLFQPRVVRAEKAKDVFSVDDWEVPADKTTDPTERKRLATVELERQRWLERHGDDGASDRALKVWMDGRLDKEIKVLEVKMDLPDFADESNPKFIAPEERSEDQQKILRDFEKKLQKRKEEVEARRKTLQAELQQIKGENLEQAKSFDETVRKLFGRRMEILRQCYEVELQQVKLIQCTVQFEHRRKLHKKVEEQRVQLADELVAATKVTQQARSKFDNLSEQLSQLQANEKHKEKHMRQLPVFCDFEDQTELLYKILMKRKPKKGKTNVDKRAEEKKARIRAEVTQEVVHHPDPFIFIEKDEELRRKLQIAEESVPLPRIDRPGECPDMLWDAFQNFRQERVDADREIKHLTEEIGQSHTDLDSRSAEEGDARQRAEEAIRQASDFQRDSVRAMYDVDQLHIFKQGLVEVEQRPVVTNYAGAILIDASHIERLNKLIRESGGEKVSLMREIGDKRKELAMIDWEIDHLSYLMGTLEMEHSHLHTLRVTKQMQAFINGGGEDHNERERSKLLQKIDHVRTSMASKIEERKRQMLTLRRANKEKELENRLLQDQVASAKELVDERHAIHNLQSSELDKERTDKLMRDMRVTRKLEDVAKAQQEEMIQLKREIDKLRERTFPSFAVVSKRVVGNPDEVM